MRFQKVGNAAISIDLILHFRKAVSFILVYFVFRYSATFLDRIDNLLRFCFRAVGSFPPANK